MFWPIMPNAAFKFMILLFYPIIWYWFSLLKEEVFLLFTTSRREKKGITRLTSGLPVNFVLQPTFVQCMIKRQNNGCMIGIALVSLGSSSFGWLLSKTLCKLAWHHVASTMDQGKHASYDNPLVATTIVPTSQASSCPAVVAAWVHHLPLLV